MSFHDDKWGYAVEQRNKLVDTRLYAEHVLRKYVMSLPQALVEVLTLAIEATQLVSVYVCVWGDAHGLVFHAVLFSAEAVSITCLLADRDKKGCI